MAQITEELGGSIKSKVLGLAGAGKVSPVRDNPNTLLKIIGKNFMSLPGFARDLNVARQNIQKLVKLEGGEPAKGADAHFLKEGEREKKLEVDIGKEEKKPTPTAVPSGPSRFKKLKDQFTSNKILTSLTKFLGLSALVGVLFVAFKDSFVEWASGLWDAIKLKFDEFTVNLQQWFLDNIQPVIDEVKNFFEDWVVRPIAGFFEKIGNFAKSYFEFWQNLIMSPVETVGKVWNGFMSLVESAQEKFQEWKDSIVEYYAKLPEWGKKLVPAFLEKKFGLVETEEEKSARESRQAQRQTAKDEDKKKLEAEKQAKDQAELDRIEKRAQQQKAERERAQRSIDERRQQVEEGKKPSAAPSEPPPKIPPAQAPSGGAPRPPSSPSDSKPVKVASESGKKAMIKAMDDYKVTDPTARAAIMAQVGHESGGFKVLSENLNYRPTTLMKIFPKYFKTPEDAERTAAAGPEAIANRVYGGRMGNAPDEGFLFRGRGFIQLTGRHNYTKFGYASNPDAVATPESGADTAMKYMMQYKGDWGDVVRVTKFVNGGTIGLDDRIKHFQEYLNDPQITKVGAVSTATSGGAVSTASGEVASGQRQQAKPQTPVVVNAPTTNNTMVAQNKTPPPMPGQKPKSTADSLASRAA